VIKPSGGITEACGTISRTPSNPQNDGGKRGHTSNTFGFGPSGGKTASEMSFAGSCMPIFSSSEVSVSSVFFKILAMMSCRVIFGKRP
jgi:hypothetical protein